MTSINRNFLPFIIISVLACAILAGVALFVKDNGSCEALNDKIKNAESMGKDQKAALIRDFRPSECR